MRWQRGGRGHTYLEIGRLFAEIYPCPNAPDLPWYWCLCRTTPGKASLTRIADGRHANRKAAKAAAETALQQAAALWR